MSAAFLKALGLWLACMTLTVLAAVFLSAQFKDHDTGLIADILIAMVGGVISMLAASAAYEHFYWRQYW